MLPYPDLFLWWVATITWSIVFLTLISIYLYVDSKKRREQQGQGLSKFVSDFVFVWILLGLLILYIVSIDRRSAVMFAVGNAVVEIILLAYVVRNRSLSSE